MSPSKENGIILIMIVFTLFVIVTSKPHAPGNTLYGTKLTEAQRAVEAEAAALMYQVRQHQLNTDGTTMTEVPVHVFKTDTAATTKRLASILCAENFPGPISIKFHTTIHLSFRLRKADYMDLEFGNPWKNDGRWFYECERDPPNI